MYDTSWHIFGYLIWLSAWRSCLWYGLRHWKDCRQAEVCGIVWKHLPALQLWCEYMNLLPMRLSAGSPHKMASSAEWWWCWWGRQWPTPWRQVHSVGGWLQGQQLDPQPSAGCLWCWEWWVRPPLILHLSLVNSCVTCVRGPFTVLCMLLTGSQLLWILLVALSQLRVSILSSLTCADWHLHEVIRGRHSIPMNPYLDPFSRWSWRCCPDWHGYQQWKVCQNFHDLQHWQRIWHWTPQVWRDGCQVYFQFNCLLWSLATLSMLVTLIFLNRNEQYKLIWGFPGQQDGWGVETCDFIYNIQSYIDAANAYLASDTSDKKRGGPYTLTNEQTTVLNAYMDLVHVSDEEFNAGTGSMLLFDLLGTWIFQVNALFKRDWLLWMNNFYDSSWSWWEEWPVWVHRLWACCC